MLNIRRFVQGADEPTWVEIVNATRKDREDLRAITVEEMLQQEQENPSFDPEGRFLAELDGNPVGERCPGELWKSMYGIYQDYKAAVRAGART